MTFVPSPLLTRRGAVASPADPELAWHYGDPLREQRAASRGPVLFDGWTGGLLTVTGADRLTWLHALASQDFAGLADGDATEALWLSPQGHVEHWADACEIGGTVWLRTEPGCAAPLAEFLRSMRFRADVEIADMTADFASLTVAGAGAADLSAAFSGMTAIAASRVARVETGWAAGVLVRAYDDRVALTVSRNAFGAVAQQLIGAGATPAGTWAADALRIAARRPRFGVDNDARTIPNETPWLASAVHLHKGCYRGQETVAKVDNVGLPPRRLVLLNLDGSGDSLPVTGDLVTTKDGKTVGRVGTVAQHWENGPIALALVKRTIGPGVPLLAGDVDAMVDPDDAVVDRPRFQVDRRTFADLRRR